MDNRIKELILGYDLCNDYVQISCYNQKTQDMDTICYIGEKMLDRIPTVLCRLYSDGSWVCGYDAWKAVNEPVSYTHLILFINSSAFKHHFFTTSAYNNKRRLMGKYFWKG